MDRRDALKGIAAVGASPVFLFREKRSERVDRLNRENRKVLTKALQGCDLSGMDDPTEWLLPEDAVLLEMWVDKMSETTFFKWGHEDFEPVQSGAVYEIFATLAVRGTEGFIMSHNRISAPWVQTHPVDRCEGDPYS